LKYAALEKEEEEGKRRGESSGWNVNFILDSAEPRARAIQLFLLGPDDASGQLPFGFTLLPFSPVPRASPMPLPQSLLLLGPRVAVGAADASNFIIPSRRTDSHSHSIPSSALPFLTPSTVYFRAKRFAHEGS